ncbi:Jag N-terminal domain-containing protein [Desulfobotulus sp. H1]|uniref:RNA-binding protein KhpB n=1 Tax=Desulfobotulus pelophilus TaxID=2823377 RepID=A0ABT3NC95_9BACT|nr:Jag N-terminal domain-containing protein [Desulfobotulus pelophilus]MCW7754801.1 Jag N-terminal domain-containing protein [Desulfobotulus pelophilus]
MNTSVEYEGKSVEDALENASRKLRIPKEKIQYDVLSYGSTGIFGLVGVKKAKIRVAAGQGKNGVSSVADRKVSALSLVDEAFGPLDVPTEEAKISPADERPSGSSQAKNRQGGQKASAGETRPLPAAGPPASDSPADLPPVPHSPVSSPDGEGAPGLVVPKKNGDKGTSKSRSRSSRSRSGRNNQQQKAASPAADFSEEEPLLPPAAETPDVRIGEGEAPGGWKEEEDQVPVEVTEEMVARGREVLEKILAYISDDVTIREEVSPGRILYNLDGGNPAIIIGKRGQTLEAIQYAVDKIVNRDAEGRVRIQMDVEGYIETRREHLQQLALKQAEKARRTGKPATIGQMNAHDRRIIHLALKDDKGVRTQSVGEGYYRRLVIFPKKVRRRRSDGNGSEDS